MTPQVDIVDIFQSVLNFLENLLLKPKTNE